METWYLHGGTLEYDDETHTYWFNGKKCLSVTQALNLLYPGKYNDIDEKVLKNAAKRGNEVHNAIECYEKYGIENNEIQEFRSYMTLKYIYDFKVLAVEIPIVIIYKDLILCGRVDMILQELSGEKCVEDHKSTCNVDRLRISSQESLYKYGIKQSYEQYNDISGLRCMHLHKRTRQYLIIDEMDAECILEEIIRLLKEKNNE